MPTLRNDRFANGNRIQPAEPATQATRRFGPTERIFATSSVFDVDGKSLEGKRFNCAAGESFYLAAGPASRSVNNRWRVLPRNWPD